MSVARSIVYLNSSKSTVKLIVEPWSEHYLVASGEEVEILGEGGEINAKMEMEQFENELVIHAWVGSVVRVLKNGVEASPSSQ